MSLPTIARHFSHTDHEHCARLNGFEAGYDHANYVEGCGPTPDTELPVRFADVAEVWVDSYQEGKDAFVCDVEDGEIVGLYRVDHGC